jgi:pilus assembly protein CpaB
LRIVTMASLGASAVLGVAKTSLPSMAEATPAAALLPAAPPPGSRPVVVAARAIAFGDRLDANHLAIAQFPPNAVPEGAFTSIDAALAQDAGGAPVALAPIAAREAVLPAKVSGPGGRASVAAEITEGMRGYTIKVTDVSGVGGHALPGDRVDVVLMRNLTLDAPAAGKNLVSQVVLQNVRVLGVDLNADPTSNKPAAPNTATLEVSVRDAQKLAVAANLGELSMALRRTGAVEIIPAATMRSQDFIGAAPPSAPAGGARPPRPSAGPAAPRLIQVVEGV